MPSTGVEVDLKDQQIAFKQVSYTASAIVGAIGLLVWWKYPITDNIKSQKSSILKDLFIVLKIRPVIYLMVIIMCAYMGYKVTDILSLYAKEIMYYSDIESGKFGSYLLYLRPIVGITLGWLSSKYAYGTILLFYGFLLTFISTIIFSLGLISGGQILLFTSSVLLMAIGVYSLRSLYFSVMEKGKIPLTLSGSAIGLISVIGYAPDIFWSPLIGHLLDTSYGIQGYQNVFIVLVICSAIGALTTWRFIQWQKSSIN